MSTFPDSTKAMTIKILQFEEFVDSVRGKQKNLRYFKATNDVMRRE